MAKGKKILHGRLLCGAAAIALMAGSSAYAQDARFNIAPQPLDTALREFGVQSGVTIMADAHDTLAKQSPGFSATADPETALKQLLAGTGLTYRRNGDVFVVADASDPQSGSAAGDGAEGTVQALIVTAQKREEDIQDVPIAISAFTQEDLTRSQVAGGPDLVTQVPNFTFTKTNFSSYSIQIRGIGTQAISATTDPAVAVAFNNTPFIRNRFFEQEFYDLERVEVLRGPQGTLYGRNATAGVVNIISAKPKFRYEAKLSADVGNYNSSRFEGMINIPLVEDKVALRIAGAWTKRDGYATNQITGNPIDGRDLWSTRVSLRFQPTDRIDANLIWEHFNEDDDRLRSGKQLCKKDVITHLGDMPVDYYAGVPDSGQTGNVVSNVQSVFSQGCTRVSLYSPEAFQTPNGLSLPYYLGASGIGLPVQLTSTGVAMDPYLSTVQSQDLRVIESTVDPRYLAKSDIGELQVSFDLNDHLTLTSETAYGVDFSWSMQDFNRFNTAPDAWNTTSNKGLALVAEGILSSDGYFCDPQLGCANRLVAVDLSTSKATQFSQELRLASNFDGPFNFSLGANFLRADSMDKYYVFINSLSLISAANGGSSGAPYVAGQTDHSDCLPNGPVPQDPSHVYAVAGCVYIDPNPISSLNDQGHNYFLSKNPYKLISYAVFGEAYYKLTDTLKITAGLRWTVDKKEAPRVPSWLLAGSSYGYSVAEVIDQEWREPTGRFAVDWKPDLSFTDETLLYASYAHGYKAGGANPPRFVYTFFGGGTGPAFANIAQQNSATRPTTFDPEFVNAFEVGSKNTLDDGRVVLNLASFYYDYTGYQVSEIVDRSAFNRNFDATVWGVELESEWRPFENLKLGFKGGYEKTRIKDGEQAVDLMDRTAGMPGWSVIRPFPTFASNCILPTALYLPPGGTTALDIAGNPFPIWGLGGPNGGNPGGCELAYIAGYDPGTQAPFGDPVSDFAAAANFWQPGTYPGFDPATAPNNGEGFYKQLGGNELPNAPHWTATVTGDYTLPLANDWLMTLHSDVHWQSQSWWRVFNDNVYDKLHPYFTMNLAAIFTNEDRGWNIMAYIKNVTDETAITGAFLNSDDTGLTTNVFLTEPRLYGLRVTKQWTGIPWLEGFEDRSHKGPYPLTVEIGGQVQRTDNPYDKLHAGFESSFPDSINNFGDAQNRDLDWGDGREVKLTYRPNASPWTISAGVRYGKTNNGTTRLSTVENTETKCGIGAKYFPFFGNVCDPSNPLYDAVASGGQLNRSTTIWSAATARDHEEHELVDFAVSRDVGMGGLSRSALSAGLRYASFDSDTQATMSGVPDRYILDGWLLPGPPVTPFHQYSTSMSAHRAFKGEGPTLSWDGSLPLLGNEETGRLELDGSVQGGVLFGTQKATIRGQGTVSNKTFWVKTISAFDELATVSVDDLTPIDINRSKDVTVPTFGASLGLSYGVDRVRIGAGYRWERYFDVLDVGQDAANKADRTIDGPYFKIAVGFGG